MRVREWQDRIVFLHQVAAGTADRSYGLHVAQLAGVPPAVVARAEAVLNQLEAGDQAGAAARLAAELPLFQARPPVPAVPPSAPALDALAEVDPDQLDAARGVGTGLSLARPRRRLAHRSGKSGAVEQWMPPPPSHTL